VKCLLCALLSLLATPAVAARPQLLGAVGVGLDVEPDRKLSDHSVDSQVLEAFTFEGEILGSDFGLLVRGMGVDGSMDYQDAGFDRLQFSVAGTWRPFVENAQGPGYGMLVLRRVSLELGFAYQRLLAARNTGDSFGIHVGAHADLPLLLRPDDSGPMLRLSVQRPLVLADDTLVTSISQNKFTVGAPTVQWAIAFAVAF
jgi:hypothetical protein